MINVIFVYSVMFAGQPVSEHRVQNITYETCRAYVREYEEKMVRELPNLAYGTKVRIACEFVRN